jgi:hypothetical protein
MGMGCMGRGACVGGVDGCMNEQLVVLEVGFQRQLAAQLAESDVLFPWL